MEITKQEFQDWKENKVTQALMQGIGKERDAWKDHLCNGNTLSGDGYSTELVVGIIRGLDQFLQIKYEDSEDE